MMKKLVTTTTSLQAPKGSRSSRTPQKKKALPAKGSKEGRPVPAGYEHKLAEQALKFVDEAASLLRGGIREGAATTAKSRIAAKKKAHNLLGKASFNLSKAIENGSSMLQDLLKKI